MKTSKKGIALIKRFEGVRLQAYRDSVGVLTIGYGHTSAAGSPRVTRTMRITKTQAEDILRADLRKFERGVSQQVDVALSQGQFDALVSFAFNVGLGALSRSTLLRKLNSGDYKSAANEFLRWTRAGSNRLKGLVRRRRAERELFLSSMPRENLRASRTIWGGAASGTGGALSLVSEEISNAADTLTGLSDFSTWLGISGAVLALGGAGLAIYARIDDHQKGVR